MHQPIPLFVELCAGTAALSLRLHRDGARPPVSRMGAKTGYADVILRILGLMPGQRAAVYLWCEPDPGVRLLLPAYRDAGLAKAAAAIIRSWAAEDPRVLWERLRAEGPPRLPDGAVEAGEVARWALGEAWQNGGRYMGPDRPSARREIDPGWTASITSEGLARRADSLPSLPATIAPDARAVDPREVARWARIVTSNRLIPVHHDGVKWCNSARNTTGAPTKGGLSFGGDDFCTPIEALAAGFGASPALPATIAPDAREVDPREVARWACWMVWTLPASKPGGGSFCGPGYVSKSGKVPFPSGTVYPHHVAARFHGIPAPLPATIAPDARTIDPPTLPPGTVCYMDPPYVATTGYAHDLPRAEVVALARRWAVAGAIVAISEAEPIPELVADGWHTVDITGQRVGQKRTFSRQQAEWVTLNRPPAWIPPKQGSLF